MLTRLSVERRPTGHRHDTTRGEAGYLLLRLGEAAAAGGAVTCWSHSPLPVGHVDILTRLWMNALRMPVT